jgi:hypothetical protein
MTVQIQVEGQLGERWARWFDGMTIAAGTGSDGSPITTLTGVVTDQAALRGLLSKVWDLNLALISVIRVEERAPDKGRQDSG